MGRWGVRPYLVGNIIFCLSGSLERSDLFSVFFFFFFFGGGLLVLGRLALLFSSDRDDGVGGIVWDVMLGCEGVGTFISGYGSLY